MSALVLGTAAAHDAVAAVLTPLGFGVARARDLHEAAALLRSAERTLVVVDWSQPDAAAACRALVALPECQAATVLALSDEHDAERLAAILTAGAADALALPADRAKLAARALHWRAARRTVVDAPFFRAAFERNPLAMCLVDDDTLQFIAVSDGAVAQYGWSREEFLTKTLRDVRPPDVVSDFDAALHRPEPFVALTTTHRRKDGSTFTSSGLLQRLQIGTRRLRYAVSRDVSQELEAKEARRRELAAYQELVERSADGVFTHRRDYTISYANPAFVAFLGFSHASELVDRSIRDFVEADQLDVVRRRVDRILDSGRPSEPQPIRFITRDGSVKWGETRGVLTNDEQPAVTVVVRDLTERRRAEEALRQSEERFSRVFQANPAAISLTRLADGHFIDVNDRFVRFTGFQRDEAIGKTGLELGLWRAPDGRSSIYDALRRDGRIRDVEVKLRGKAGTVIDALMSAETIDIAGEAYALVIAIDITERKALEEQLRHAQKMEAIGRLAGGVAHDFNNLLTGIRGYSEILLGQSLEGSSMHDAAEHIHRSALRAASLTSQLLVFTRRQPMQPQVVVLDDEVRPLGAMLGRTLGPDIALALQLGCRDGHVRIDPAQLEQIVLNLAVNARDAMPRGGRLEIATDHVVDDRGGRRVRLRVTDTGIGMDETVRSRMFEPFFTTKEVGRGTGLGLAIVYGIIEDAGGTIAVDSAPGRGTSFDIRLPEVAAPADAPRPEQAETAGPRGHGVVLLVEDDEDVRDFVQFVLGRAGYDVVVANSAAHALTAVEARRDVQLVVSDVVMPQMSGDELADRLCARNPSMKVLLMSGYPAGAVEAGRDTPFLQKPFSASELLRRVRGALDEPAASQTPPLQK